MNLMSMNEEEKPISEGEFLKRYNLFKEVMRNFNPISSVFEPYVSPILDIDFDYNYSYLLNKPNYKKLYNSLSFDFGKFTISNSELEYKGKLEAIMFGNPEASDLMRYHRLVFNGSLKYSGKSESLSFIVYIDHDGSYNFQDGKRIEYSVKSLAKKISSVREKEERSLARQNKKDNEKSREYQKKERLKKLRTNSEIRNKLEVAKNDYIEILENYAEEVREFYEKAKEKIYPLSIEMRNGEKKRIRNAEDYCRIKFGSGFNLISEEGFEREKKYIEELAEIEIENAIELVERTGGEILDILSYEISENMKINGYFETEKGRVHLLSFLAGGYNIQQLHFRTTARLID